MRVAFVASAVPRRCGIATFTFDVVNAVKSADPTVRITQAAIDEPGAARAYGPEVRWRIRQEDWRTYRAAALGINATNVDIVNVQHEFGLYGLWHHEVTGGHRTRHAGDRAPWPASPQEAARSRGSPDRVDVRPGRSPQGPRVRHRGDARHRGQEPERGLPHRRSDPSRAAEETG